MVANNLGINADYQNIVTNLLPEILSSKLKLAEV